MRSGATTVEEYLTELPEARRVVVSAVRDVIVANLPAGYEESMNWGMISYEVPLSVCPDTYNGQPLMYAALAAQKRHYAVYLMGIYISDELRIRFEEAYRATGKRLDVGKSCVRFRSLDDLPLELIGEAIAELPMADYIAQVGTVASARKSRGKGRGKAG